MIGTDRIEQFGIAKNEVIVYASNANLEQYFSKYRDAELEAGSNCYYIRAVQDDLQFAWRPPIRVEERPADPAIEAVAVVSERVSSATDAGIPFARGSRCRLAVSPGGQSVHGLRDARPPPECPGHDARFAPLGTLVEVALPRCAMLGAEGVMKGKAEQSTPVDTKPVFKAFRAANVDEETAYEATYAIQNLAGWNLREALAAFRRFVEAKLTGQDAKIDTVRGEVSVVRGEVSVVRGEVSVVGAKVSALAREVRFLRWLILVFFALWTFWLAASELGWIGSRVIVREIQTVASESVQPPAAPPPAVTESSGTQPQEELVE